MIAISPAPTHAPPGAVPAAAIDPRELRQVLGSFVTGVTVITTVDETGRWWGLTANSFTSVSLNPPLVLWNQSTSAPSFPAFRDAQRFAVSILAEDQVDLSRRFSSSAPDKFEGVPVRMGLGGVPLIEGCTAYLECAREGGFPGGDHAVFLGRVERMEKHARPPLVFGQGRYLKVQPQEAATAWPDLDQTAASQQEALGLATPLLAELSRELDRSTALSVWGNHGPTIVRWEPAANDPLNARLLAGQVCRLLTSATGLAWSAFGPASADPALFDAELNAPLDQAPRSREEAQALMASMRTHGMARVVASPHFTDRYGTRINAAAAPVFDAAGSMVLAITAVGDARTTDVDADSALCQRLRAAASQLSARLGFNTSQRPDHGAAPSFKGAT